MLGDSRAVEIRFMGGHAAAGEDTGGVAVAHRPALRGSGAAHGDVNGVVAIDDREPQSAGVVVGECVASHIGQHGPPTGDLRDSVLQPDEGLEIDHHLHLGGGRLVGGPSAEEIQQDVGPFLVEASVVGQLASEAVDVGEGGIEPVRAYSLRS